MQQLLTKSILSKLPPLYANENKKPEETEIIVKFFNPAGVGTWYVTEYNPETRICFGVADLGWEKELGYFSLDELEEFRDSRLGTRIERDIWFPKTMLSKILES